MARTDVHGITIDRFGRRTIDKAHRGERIFARLGAVSREDAERYLAKEVDRIEWEGERRMHAYPLFSDCAKRSLRESGHKRSVTTLTWHIELLLRHVGDLAVHRVHEDTLRPLVEARLAEGVRATTFNRTLEVVRTILHRAARAYRDDDGMPWLEIAPPLIRCSRSTPERTTRSPGTSRSGSSAAYPTISRTWRSSPSTRGFEIPIYAICDGRGKCPSLRWVAACS